MFDKKTILSKSKYFPGSSKYFKIDYPSHDANVYLSAVNGLTNIAIANRILIANYVHRILKKFKTKFKFDLMWDSCHDTIKKLIQKVKKFIHT